MLRAVAIAVLALLSFSGVYVAVACYLATHGERSEPPDERFDAIVVLGCRVEPGGVPSNALERRAANAARLYHEGRARWVVTTGGVGEHGPSEGSVARGVLIAHGVPADRILVEDASTSTEENARYAKERFGGRRVLVVTDAYHVLRSEHVFLRYYEDAHAVGTSSAYRDVRVRGALREVFAVVAYLGLGRWSFATQSGGARSDPGAPRSGPLRPWFALTALAPEPRGRLLRARGGTAWRRARARSRGSRAASGRGRRAPSRPCRSPRPRG